MRKNIDVIGIGNAIVDVISSGTDESIRCLELAKGTMRLVDLVESARIYDAMGPCTEVSGGSVSNTLAVLSSLGGRACLIAKVSDDDLGRFFTHDMRSGGVDFDPSSFSQDTGTGRCLIQVTPDGERTMATYLGASVELGASDVEAKTDLFPRAGLIFFEGYLLDSPYGRSAVAQAVSMAKENGVPLATSLGDARCVSRNHGAFLELVRDVSLLFANEKEISALSDTETGVDDALSKIAREGLTAVVTRGADGCSVMHDGILESFPSCRPERLIDTTGAGDSFAAGYSYGWIKGWQQARCARLGASVAARIISHVGARPKTPLTDLLEETPHQNPSVKGI